MVSRIARGRVSGHLFRDSEARALALGWVLKTSSRQILLSPLFFFFTFSQHHQHARQRLCKCCPLSSPFSLAVLLGPVHVCSYRFYPALSLSSTLSLPLLEQRQRATTAVVWEHCWALKNVCKMMCVCWELLQVAGRLWFCLLPCVCLDACFCLLPCVRLDAPPDPPLTAWPPVFLAARPSHDVAMTLPPSR